MLDLYHKLTIILDKRELRLAYLVLLLTIFVATIEVLGVASIMPFMAVLANPGIVETNHLLSFVYGYLGFQSVDSYLFFIGVCVLVFLVGSTFLKAFLVWVHVYYANLRNLSIGTRMISGFLQQPYQWFLMRNSSKLATSILNEVSRVVHGQIYPMLRLISNSIIAILLLVLFMLIDPILAISIMAFLAITYGAIFKFASKRLARMGGKVSKSQQKRLKVIQEAFGGIKDVKIAGLENAFLDRFQTPARNLALSNISIKLWAEMPAFGMQALIFGGMMVMILYLMQTRSGLEETLPVLALYALGGYKLMPALQEIYKQLAQLKFDKAALDSVYQDIQLINSLDSLYIQKTNTTPLAIREFLELRELQYSYPGTDKKALNDISIKISKNSTVGFVGSSGSGKTTTVDIILGLLQPSHGGLFIDNHEIKKNNLRSWQRSLGYVPQQIFLSDDSIASNIAFGIPHTEIDSKKIEKASRTAHLHEFVVNELPEGYNTLIGERGVRLSGGQRQRIGIARALYHNPDILILDEATSALDNITEKAVMDAVNEIGHKKTIIIIAHRLTTVKPCDKIFLFENGKIEASGNYEELIKTNQKFRDIALIEKQH